jgi:excinuclease UvrABC nuclease subunit
VTGCEALHHWANKETEVYRHFDKEGRLLYVGMGFQAVKRLRGHKKSSPRFGQIARMTIVSYPRWEQARAVERRAISIEKPLYNKNERLWFDQIRGLKRGRRR